MCVVRSVAGGRGVSGWGVSCQAQGCLMQRVSVLVPGCCCGCRVLLLERVAARACVTTLWNMLQQKPAAGGNSLPSWCVTSTRSLANITLERTGQLATHLRGQRNTDVWSYRMHTFHTQRIPEKARIRNQGMIRAAHTHAAVRATGWPILVACNPDPAL